LKPATASSRVETLPMFVRSRPSRTRAERALFLEARSQSRKTDKIASSDVARSRVDWNTFRTP